MSKVRLLIVLSYCVDELNFLTVNAATTTVQSWVILENKSIFFQKLFIFELKLLYNVSLFTGTDTYLHIIYLYFYT